jgi:hypothetical protein
MLSRRNADRVFPLSAVVALPWQTKGLYFLFFFLTIFSRPCVNVFKIYADSCAMFAEGNVVSYYDNIKHSGIFEFVVVLHATVVQTR